VRGNPREPFGGNATRLSFYPVPGDTIAMEEHATPPSHTEPLVGESRLLTDSLTGLPNEHMLRLHLPTEFARSRDGETNASFLALRLDNILAINAAHGRTGGDEALRALAYVLDNYRAGPGRKAHVAFRLAGPLFGYLIPACSAPEARAAAEDIRQLVQQSELYIGHLTASIGIANFYEFFMDDGNQEQLAVRILQTALHRLGIAERQGANTICDASDTSAAVVSSRPTVLLVDPEPGSMELLVRALEAAEISVLVREDGESAVAAVQESPPSVIICEAACPRLSGFSVRERLRANALWNAIPFILVSHRKNDDMVRKAVENDIRHFFRKPVSLTEVVGLVVNLTRQRQ
jgi:diguanylate cyclase (GGDEF)-like protein